jgi:hypothetical protein
MAAKRQSGQSQHQKAASSTSLASLFAPSSAGTGAEEWGRAKSDRRRSVVIDGLRSDIRRSSTKESLLNLTEDAGTWLDITGKDILTGLRAKEEVMKVVQEDMGMEEAVEVSLAFCLVYHELTSR